MVLCQGVVLEEVVEGGTGGAFLSSSAGAFAGYAALAFDDAGVDSVSLGFFSPTKDLLVARRRRRGSLVWVRSKVTLTLGWKGVSLEE